MATPARYTCCERCTTRLGMAYRPNQHTDRIDAAPHSFTVHTGDAPYTAPKLVIAAGLGSRTLAPLVGLDVPVAPQQGQIIVTERVRKLLDYPTHMLRQTEEGTVMLGDSAEDAGFDTTTRVHILQKIAERNIRTFPALKQASIIRTWAALRVMSPDGFPIYEQSARYPGAFATTCHSGVTLAGVHALALAPAILTGELPGETRRFHLRPVPQEPGRLDAFLSFRRSARGLLTFPADVPERTQRVCAGRLRRPRPLRPAAHRAGMAVIANDQVIAFEPAAQGPLDPRQSRKSASSTI